MNLAVTVALLPALFTPGDATPDEVDVAAGLTLETLPVRATAPAGSTDVVVLGPSEIAASAATTTTTTAPPTTTTTIVRPKTAPTTAKPAVKAAPKAAPKPAPTTTTAKPAPKPTTTTVSPEAGTESGKASWYDHRAGVCAHKSLPFGTVVTVTHTGNGKSTTCTVGDRGPFVEGWIIDLHPEQFEALAPRSAGVIPVRITW